MNHSVEKLEGSMAKLTFEVAPEQFRQAIVTVYNKAKKNIQIPGFRKGHAPLAMVEQYYGKGVFDQDALNEVLPELYAEAVKEEKLEVMSRPSVEVGDMEEGKPFSVVCTMAIKPVVTLGDYKALKKEEKDVTVTDEDVDAEIKNQAKRNARKVEVTDRPAQMDDIVTIDFEGFVDGVAFEGGKAEDFDLTLGSHSFIDTFEDQLVGKNVGEECEVNVTFPEAYHQESLAGKPATFKVTVKKIQFNELPEINDAFVSDISEFDTVDAYKEDVRKKLQERKEKEAATAIQNKLLEQLVESSSMDMPEPMVDEQIDQMLNQFAQSLRYQGMDINGYLKATNTSMETLRGEIKPDAEKRLKENLVLGALAEAEKVEVTDEDLDKELEQMAATYSMEASKLKELIGEGEIEDMKAGMLNRKALETLVANAQ